MLIIINVSRYKLQLINYTANNYILLILSLSNLYEMVQNHSCMPHRLCSKQNKNVANYFHYKIYLGDTMVHCWDRVISMPACATERSSTIGKSNIRSNASLIPTTHDKCFFVFRMSIGHIGVNLLPLLEVYTSTCNGRCSICVLDRKLCRNKI
jgi:hypothetical protein